MKGSVVVLCLLCTLLGGSLPTRAAAINRKQAPLLSGQNSRLLVLYEKSKACNYPFIPMTDLLHTIPDFPTKLYTHLLPSLEKHLITTTDLLTLDALEVAKRAQLPLLDVRRLANHVLAILQGRLGLKTGNVPSYQNAGEGQAGYGSLRKAGKEAITRSSPISTLDPAIDAALGGGVPTGYITEITGERYDQ